MAVKIIRGKLNKKRVKKTLAIDLEEKKFIQCPNELCKSYHTVRHGFNATKKGKFTRRKCQDCGTTFYEGKKIERNMSVHQ